MADMFTRPIPGQSLTGTPKNAPWERPPEIVEVKDVVKHYVERLADEDVMDDIAVTFELGADLKSFVTVLTTTGVMKGLHTVEAGMLAGPDIGAFIKAAMSTYGIEVKETNVSKEEDKERRVKERLMRVIKSGISKADQEDAGTELLGEMAATEKPQEAEEGSVAEESSPEEMAENETPTQEAEEQASTGLMSKGAM